MKEPKLRFAEFTGDWNNYKLENIVDIYDGTHQTPKYQNSGVMFVSVEDIETLESNKFISESDFQKEYSVFPQKGDILMTRIGDIGTANVVTSSKPLAYYVSLALLKNQKNDSNFLKAGIMSPSFQKELWTRTLHTAYPQKINKQEIGQCLISLPPTICEQTKIGKCFENLDNLIQSAEKELEGYREFKQGMLQKMFPKKGEKVPEVRFPEFTGDWEQRKLGDICKTYSGGTPKSGKSSYYDNGTIPFIRSGEIHNDRTELYITEDGMNESSAKMVDIGDILYALYGATSGEVDISKINGAINQAILCIRPTTGFDRKFIVEILRHNKESILRTYLQGGQGNLSAQIIQSQIFNFPCLAEQQRIGKYFQNLDNLIASQQQELDGYKELKKGLLQQMFC